MSKWIIVPFVILIVFIAAEKVLAVSGDTRSGKSQKSYLDGLVDLSSQKHLSSQRYWHLLLHYQKDIFGRTISLADGPGFFLSPHGKNEPQEELEATLEKFFSDELVGTSEQPAQCAFPARYDWLKEELGFDRVLLPEQDCKRFNKWIKAIDPESVTLIFPSSYMNNPSSMFGHTLLRIDQKGQTEQTRILAYVINYAASVTTENGFIYAYNGLAGGFEGHFSIMPYYIKVQEYSEMENRDIWEYHLNFDQKQVLRMLMHAWELGNTYFDYYFLTENCSYHLLSLLEIADPKIHITDSSRFWIIPADTVRWVTEQPGLVSDVVYRPSRSTQILRKREQLTQNERAWLERIRKHPEAIYEQQFTSFPINRQVLVLDVAYDYFRYLSLSDDENLESYKKNQKTILEARSALKTQSIKIDIDPITTPPETGHRTARVGIGMGWGNDEPFEELSLRPGYHDLLDDETGYTRDAQIEGLSIRLRHYNHSNQTKLESLSLVNILSLTPMDTFFKKPSWKLDVGWKTLSGNECSLCTIFHFNGGIGGAFQSNLLRREVLYALGELETDYGSVFSPNYRAGGGGTSGLLVDLTKRWKLHLFTTYLSFPFGNRSHEVRRSLHQRLTLHKDLALRIELDRRKHQTQGLIRVDLYL